MINYAGKELAAAARTVRKNTIQVAEEIPEDKYDFVPAPGARSVRQTLAHIAQIPALQYDIHRDRKANTLQGYDWNAFAAKAGAFESASRSKAELIALLKETGEAYASWVETLSPAFLNETFTDPMGQNPKTRFESLMSVKEHEMHHRGQLMLVLRILGGVPHLTRERQARAAARAAS
jgi:uncharacterized damage-inducible protein DinB